MAHSAGIYSKILQLLVTLLRSNIGVTFTMVSFFTVMLSLQYHDDITARHHCNLIIMSHFVVMLV